MPLIAVKIGWLDTVSLGFKHLNNLTGILTNSSNAEYVQLSLLQAHALPLKINRKSSRIALIHPGHCVLLYFPPVLITVRKERH